MFFNLIALILGIFVSNTCTFPSDWPLQDRKHALAPRAQARTVKVIVNFATDSFWTKEGNVCFRCHSALFISGNDQDGPLKIEIEDDLSLPYEKSLYIRVIDFTTAKKDFDFLDTNTRDVILQNPTYFTNKAFMDPETGKGLVADTWAMDHNYRAGPIPNDDLNDCNTFVQRFVEKALGDGLNPHTDNYFFRSKLWSLNFRGSTDVQDITDLRLETAGTGGRETNTEKKFVLHDCSPASSEGKRGETCNAQVPAADDKPPTKVNELSQNNEFSRQSDQNDRSDSETSLDDGIIDRKSPAAAINMKDKSTKTTLARVGGKLTSFTAISEDALGVLGVAGSIVGAVFVILDFVDHNWVG